MSYNVSGGLGDTDVQGLLSANRLFSRVGSTGTQCVLGGVLDLGEASIGNNVGGADTEAQVYGLPADALANPGEGIVYRAVGTFAATASEDKRIKVYFGATPIFDTGPLAITTSNSWLIIVNVNMLIGGTQACTITYTSSSNALPATAVFALAAENLATEVEILLKISGTNANDVVALGSKTMWEGAI